MRRRSKMREIVKFDSAKLAECEAEGITEYSKPKTKKGKCFNCGAEIEIGISRYNGHKHYHCNKCGMSMIE